MQQPQEDVEEFSVAVQIRMIALDLRWLDILNLHFLKYHQFSRQLPNDSTIFFIFLFD